MANFRYQAVNKTVLDFGQHLVTSQKPWGDTGDTILVIKGGLRMILSERKENDINIITIKAVLDYH